MPAKKKATPVKKVGGTLRCPYCEKKMLLLAYEIKKVPLKRCPNMKCGWVGYTTQVNCPKCGTPLMAVGD